MERITWKETRDRLREDRRRIASASFTSGGAGRASVRLSPSYLCVLLHRLSHYLYLSGHRLMARMLWQLNLAWTGADISPLCDLGPGLLIPSPASVTIDGNAGRNLTVMPLSGMGSELGRPADVGAGSGLPILGDDVLLAPKSGVLGPVRIGHRVRLAPGVVITRDLPDDAVVEPPAARFFRQTGSPSGQTRNENDRKHRNDPI